MRDLLKSIPGFAEPRPPVAAWEWFAVIAATLVGIVLRFWALDSIPPGLWYDEAIYGLDGLDVLRGRNRPIFFDTYGHMREPLYMYLLALGLAVGPVEAWTIRAVSAVIGAATIPVTWWMARELAGPRVALWTVLVFAPMRWHVHFSRTAFRVILSPLFAAATVALLARMVRRPTLTAGILLGVALGGGLYTYLSMRLFVVAVGVGLALAWWMASDRRATLRAAGAAVATAFIVFAPLGVDFLRHPEHFTGRAGEVSLFEEGRGGWRRIATQARDVALMTTIRGDHEPKHSIPGWPTFAQGYLLTNHPHEGGAAWRDAQRNDPDGLPDVHGTGAPVFDLVTGSLFMLALLMTLIRAARGCWPSAMLALWLLIGSLASILSFGAPNMLRMVFLTPAVACVVALGLEAALRGVAGRGGWRWAGAVAGVFLIWFAAGEMRRYFYDWTTSPETPDKFSSNFVELSAWIRDHPDRPDTVVFPRYLLEAPTILFETDRISGRIADGDWQWDGSRAWLVAPVAPYPPLTVDEEILQRATLVQRLHQTRNWVWVEVLEVAPDL